MLWIAPLLSLSQSSESNDERTGEAKLFAKVVEGDGKHGIGRSFSHAGVVSLARLLSRSPQIFEIPPSWIGGNLIQ